MPASIGVNLRVTGHCSQGGRKYMEDLFSVAYQQTEDERDLEYAFFGIYDGHGGSEAAAFAKEHLMDSIVKQRQFWSDNDEDVLKAIRNGYMLTHLNMWKELEKWPKTVTGLPSTAGTTASVAFIRRGKIYIGHVGDSAIILGYQKDGCEEWAAKPLTLDHKPESTIEIERIQRCGGKVISKAGVPRVVWNRPRAGHKGPIKKNTPMDEIPFLAVARSLGDLWSYNTQNDEFIVSPDPDVGVLVIDPSKFRCLIFGTDGLWNMLSPEGAVSLVQATERHNEAALVGNTSGQPKDWLNPSKSLVDNALERWSTTRMRADNTSVVTLMLDPPGPPRATVLRSRNTQRPAAPAPLAPLAPLATLATLAPPHPLGPHVSPVTTTDKHEPEDRPPQNGLTIMTRYSDAEKPAPEAPDAPEKTPLPPCATLDGRFSAGVADEDCVTTYGNPAESLFIARLLNRSRVVNTLSEVFEEIVSVREPTPPPATAVPDRAPPAGPADPADPADAEPEPASDEPAEDIQINEVSSSSPTDAPARGGRARRPRGGAAGAAAGAGAGSARVLRSHDASPPPAPPRPPARPADRVVILSRAKGVPVPPAAAAAAPVPAVPATAARQTRSRDALAGTTVVRSGTQSRTAASGNCGRRDATECCKENCRRRRAAAPAPAPPATRPPRRHRDSPEVHSTTGECAARLAAPAPAPAPAPAAAAPAPRALRSRNHAGEAPPAAGKRARCDALPDVTHKMARVSGPTRPAPRRPAPAAAPAPWGPALALRNRLRKRLVK